MESGTVSPADSTYVIDIGSGEMGFYKFCEVPDTPPTSAGAAVSQGWKRVHMEAIPKYAYAAGKSGKSGSFVSEFYAEGDTGACAFAQMLNEKLSLSLSRVVASSTAFGGGATVADGGGQQLTGTASTPPKTLDVRFLVGVTGLAREYFARQQERGECELEKFQTWLDRARDNFVERLAEAYCRFSHETHFSHVFDGIDMCATLAIRKKHRIPKCYHNLQGNGGPAGGDYYTFGLPGSRRVGEAGGSLRAFRYAVVGSARQPECGRLVHPQNRKGRG